MLRSVGIELSAEDFVRAGRRIWNLTRLINCREGWTSTHARLPTALLNAQIESGKAVSAGVFEQMKAEYYRLRGWDENGRPGRALIESLGLGEHARKLEPARYSD